MLSMSMSFVNELIISPCPCLSKNGIGRDCTFSNSSLRIEYVVLDATIVMPRLPRYCAIKKKTTKMPIVTSDLANSSMSCLTATASMTGLSIEFIATIRAELSIVIMRAAINLHLLYLK